MLLLLLKEHIILFLFVVTAEAPYIVPSAVYILHLVLWYQQKYSEKSETS